MDRKALENAQKAGVETTAVRLEPPLQFRIPSKDQYGSPININSTYAETMDSELHIRQAITLVLRQFL